MAGPSQFVDLTEAVLGTASDALFAAVRDVLAALCARAGAEAAPAAARAAARKAAGRASLKGAPAGLLLPPPSPPLPRSPGGPAGRSASAAVLAPAAWSAIVASLADKPPACFGLPPDGPTLDTGGDGTGDAENAEGTASAHTGITSTSGVSGASGGVSTAAALWPAVVALEALPLQACVSGKLRVLLKTMHAIHSGVALQRAAAAAAAAAAAEAEAAASAAAAETAGGEAPAAEGGAAVPPAATVPSGSAASEAIPSVAPAALAADDLLPRLCWVLSRASCPQLPSELALVEELMPPQHAMTELGYAATMARSAMLAAASMAQ